MRMSHTDLVLGTYHAKGFHSAYFALFYLELLVAVIEHRAHSGNYHCLSGGYIRSAADYLHRPF